MTRLAAVLAGAGLFLTVFGFTIVAFTLGADPIRADARLLANGLSVASILSGLILMASSGLKERLEPEPIRVRVKR